MWFVMGDDEGVEVIIECFNTYDEALTAHDAWKNLPENVNITWRIEFDNDDDPQCVCGAYRSEHALLRDPSCSGFTTADEWEREKAWITDMSDEEFERVYGG